MKSHSRPFDDGYKNFRRQTLYKIHSKIVDHIDGNTQPPDSLVREFLRKKFPHVPRNPSSRIDFIGRAYRAPGLTYKERITNLIDNELGEQQTPQNELGEYLWSSMLAKFAFWQVRSFRDSRVMKGKHVDFQLIACDDLVMRCDGIREC